MAASQETSRTSPRERSYSHVVTVTTEDLLVRPSRKKPGEAIEIPGWAGTAAFSTDHFFASPIDNLHVSLAHVHLELGKLKDRIPFTILTHPFPKVNGYLDIYRFKPNNSNRRLPKEYVSREAHQNPHAIRISLTNLAREQASLRPQNGGALFVIQSGNKEYAAHIGSVIDGETMSVSSDGWIAPRTMRHVEVLLGHEDLSGVKYILTGIKTPPIPGSN